MQRLEEICRIMLNISNDIKFYEIVKFFNKFDGYNSNILFLINFEKERRLINEDEIKMKDKGKYKVFAFTPSKPQLDNPPKSLILYCKVLNSTNGWEYLKVQTNPETTKKIWNKSRIPLRVFIYKML